MANYDGLLKENIGYTDATNNVASGIALDSTPFENATEYAYAELSYSLSGTKSSGVQTVSRFNYSGSIHQTFFEQLYLHLHVIPSRLELGNLISTQTRGIEIWNATYQDVTLLSVNQINLNGVLINTVTPTIYKPLESKLVDVTFGLTGAASLNGSLEFVFADNGSGLYNLLNYVIVTGKRVVVFPFRHNYNTQIEEEFEFLTEVHESDNGYEQLIAKRLFPRHSFNQDVVLVKGNDIKANAQLSAYFKSIMTGWQAKVFSVGRWHDQTQLQTTINAGTSLINLDTVGRSYEVGSFIMFWKDEFINEVVEIQSLTDTTITFTRPLNLTWQAYSTRVLPAKLSRVADNVSVNLLTKTIQQPTLKWNTLETLTDTKRLKTETMSLYRNFPVMMRKNNIESDSQTYQHKIAIADSQTGVKYFDTLRQYAPKAQPFMLVSLNRTEFAKVLYILYQLRGMYGALWMPTWEFDMFVRDTTIEPTLTSFNIDYIGYARYRLEKGASKDIMILMKNGDVYFRRIIGSIEASDLSSESIQIDTSLSNTVAIQTANIERISFINLSRGLSDNFGVSWISGDGKALFNFEVVETNENK